MELMVNKALEQLALKKIVSVYENPHNGRSLLKVKQHNTELDYALKVFDLKHNDRATIRSEVTALNRLPFGLVPHVHQMIEVDEYLFLKSDWIDGVTFTEFYSGEVTDHYDANARIGLIIKAGKRLQHIHKAGLIHRDIKPDNLILVRPGATQLKNAKIFIIDFGITTQRRTLEEGTIGFRAPEQYISRATRLSEKTDVFGLAQSLWFLLSGEPASLQVNAKMNAWEMPDYPLLSPQINQAAQLFELLEMATEFSPNDRPTLAEFINSLQKMTRI